MAHRRTFKCLMLRNGMTLHAPPWKTMAIPQTPATKQSGKLDFVAFIKDYYLIILCTAYHDEVRNEKHSSTILVGQIRKSPHIAQTDRVSHACQMPFLITKIWQSTHCAFFNCIITATKHGALDFGVNLCRAIVILTHNSSRNPIFPAINRPVCRLLPPPPGRRLRPGTLSGGASHGPEMTRQQCQAGPGKGGGRFHRNGWWNFWEKNALWEKCHWNTFE